MHVVGGASLPIFVWPDFLEAGAEEQARHAADLPFAFYGVGVMPDGHRGYGMPIGGVMATKDGVIVPYAIGTDIGCGVCAAKTNIIADELNIAQLQAIVKDIQRSVPLRRRQEPIPLSCINQAMPDTAIMEEERSNAKLQLGTLGGGNHFIELQRGVSDGMLWIMIHTGSRHLGHAVCTYYDTIAQTRNSTQYSQVPASWQLAFLSPGPIADEYIQAMNYCTAYSRVNRQLIMEQVQSIIIGIEPENVEQTIDVHHNYAALENHFGKNVWVHRKGAIRARVGDIGIVPGSQGTSSFIVRGLGHPKSFNSCSHGAGRAFSRSKARKELSLDKELKRLLDVGVVHSLTSERQLDEAPGAYKDINEVMRQQSDLCEIVEELTPIAVVKG